LSRLAKLEARLRAGDPAVTWEYRAIDALGGDGGTAAAAAAGAEPTHGPFTTAQMVSDIPPGIMFAAILHIGSTFLSIVLWSLCGRCTPVFP
tara:strand:- start:84 stop:359 length:276 start_codon:yes stop_codon:yes gene_type:complete